MNSRDLIRLCLSGEATHTEFQELNERLASDAELRREWVMEASVDTGLRQIALERMAEGGEVKGRRQQVPAWRFTAIAAVIAFLLGLSFIYFGGDRNWAKLVEDVPPAEVPSAQGFAVIVNLLEVKWRKGSDFDLRPGDSLSAEVLTLESGVAEIRFFSGATMVVRGPAEIALQSAWEATCHEGSVRMMVPPAARGFKLRGPATEIVDLGTEFGFEVRNGEGHVEVLDGEIEIRHRSEQKRVVEKGAAWQLPADDAAVAVATDQIDFPQLSGFGGELVGFKRWQLQRDALANDPRVIGYYTFEADSSGSFIPSISEPFNDELNGAIVLAESAAGRWGNSKKALEFRRPGARVRVRIPGEFQALTFAAWVRIDSLDRRYNALFMGDGYETGEPHWQIRDDGKLMLSVMVDDSIPHPKYPEVRYHHVYFSPPIWEMSMSGQWIHLVSVFDPENELVSHYVNGDRLSSETIKAEFVIKTLRIGNGEIGNWGQPFRKTPSFAIRNLNGRIDEIVIFNAALSGDEVSELYLNSQALNK